LYDGSLPQLQERFGGDRELVVDFAEPYPDPQVAGATISARDGQRVTYRFGRADLTASELIGRLSARYRIRDLAVREPEIESTIRRIYEERLLD
jgi:ABC-2 type transport system ATP-binding protein